MAVSKKTINRQFFEELKTTLFLYIPILFLFYPFTGTVMQFYWGLKQKSRLDTYCGDNWAGTYIPYPLLNFVLYILQRFEWESQRFKYRERVTPSNFVLIDCIMFLVQKISDQTLKPCTQTSFSQNFESYESNVKIMEPLVQETLFQRTDAVRYWLFFTCRSGGSYEWAVKRKLRLRRPPSQKLMVCWEPLETWQAVDCWSR